MTWVFIVLPLLLAIVHAGLAYTSEGFLYLINVVSASAQLTVACLMALHGWHVYAQ